jgi:hypothetical protein
VFHALAPELRQVVWRDKFKPGPINKYDDYNNSEEFIEATGGEDRVKANYLTMTLSDATRSWLIKLPEGTIYNRD